MPPTQPQTTPVTEPAHAPIAGLGQSGTGHYENFPVASWLCPAPLRAPIRAIYHFARTADDLADEGQASAGQRLQALCQYRQALADAVAGRLPATGPWALVFGPLAQAIARHRLPPQLLHDLLSAFEQDVRHTESGHRYADQAELLAYCALSANPVGRLLLHLYGIDDDHSLRQSDQICSALQLINFWQDLSVDLPRGRHYLPADALRRHGIDERQLMPPFGPDPAGATALVAELCEQARAMMQQGAPLALRLPGRAGWELRLVVQGGLRILDLAAAQGHRTWRVRPALGKGALPLLLWRAWRMRAA